MAPRKKKQPKSCKLSDWGYPSWRKVAECFGPFEDVPVRAAKHLSTRDRAKLLSLVTNYDDPGVDVVIGYQESDETGAPPVGYLLAARKFPDEWHFERFDDIDLEDSRIKWSKNNLLNPNWGV